MSLPGLPEPNYDDPDLAGSPAGSLATSIILGALACFAVAARLWARISILRRPGLDDVAIVIALILGISFNVTHEIEIRRFGFGKHFWDIPYELIEPVAMVGFVNSQLYLYATGFIKLSILLFFRRLLRGSHGSLAVYSRINHVLLAIIFSCMIGLSIAVLYTCNPIQAFWKQHNVIFQLTKSFDCDGNFSALVAATYISFLTDVAIVVFPLVFIRHIQIQKREKWALRALFFVCIIACIAGLIQSIFMTVMTHTGVKGDHSYYGFYSLLWGMIEIYTGTICACTPALKPFFTKYFSSTVRSSENPSSLAKRYFSRGSRARDEPISSSTTRNRERDTESDTYIELLKGSRSADIADARQEPPDTRLEAQPAMEPKSEVEHPQFPNAVLKRVDVEVTYLPDASQSGSSTPSAQA